jgi:Flp pilus assembly secretin CpaC
MIRRNLTETKPAARGAAFILVLALVLAVPAGGALAAAKEAIPVTVPAGQSIVLEMAYDVSTVSIADPDVADAAVGSERTVVVNGKKVGVTSLVVWEEGGRHTLYTVSTVASAPAPPQVLLQCKVSELLEDKLSEWGIDWISKGSGTGLKGTLEGGLFVTKVETPNNPLLLGPSSDGFVKYVKDNGTWSFMSTLRAMEESGAARTLASPNLVAVSGDSASMLAGGEFPIPVVRSATEGGISVTIEWKQFGISLKFRPTVLDSNRIRLTVEPEVSAPDESRAVNLGGYLVPGVVTRRASTTVEMGDGDVLVIGGLKQTETTKHAQVPDPGRHPDREPGVQAYPDGEGESRPGDRGVPVDRADHGSELPGHAQRRVEVGSPRGRSLRRKEQT